MLMTICSQLHCVQGTELLVHKAESKSNKDDSVAAN